MDITRERERERFLEVSGQALSSKNKKGDNDLHLI
jgi:hypothetical protein